MKQDLIGPEYFSDPYYRSAAYQEKLAAAQQQEQVRQALVRGEATEETLAYARYLEAVENDATISHGSFGRFAASDQQVVRRWPFLADLVAQKGGAK